jgi:predicted metal-dependent peptidase
MTTLVGADLKMARAKTSLVLSHPFYATLALNMPWVKTDPEDPSCPTMCTDGETVYWNPGFVEKMTHEETMFVICHEILHCVFDHMGRIKNRDGYNWNVATDIVINDMLKREGIGTMPEGGLDNPQLAAAGKYLAEDVYSLLPPPPPKGKQGYHQGKGQPKGGKGQMPLDQIRPRQGSKAQQSAAANIMKVRVAQAAQAAKMCGKMSADMERLVGSVLKPQVDWKDVLRRFVSARAKIDHSFARPKRRFLADDLYLPSMSGERLGNIVVAVDCSGSIGQKELDEFAAEIYAIHADCRPVQLDVLYFDSVISHHDSYTSEDTPKIVGHGGGGTAFSPIFKFIDDKAIEAVACVVLTDGYCSDYGPAPSYPVLWITTGETKFPWGEVVEMKGGRV